MLHTKNNKNKLNNVEPTKTNILYLLNIQVNVGQNEYATIIDANTIKNQDNV